MSDVVKYDQVTATPTPKVAAGGIGGSVSVVLIWVVRAVTDIEIPAEVAAAIATIVAFVSAYFTRDAKPIEAVAAIREDADVKG